MSHRCASDRLCRGSVSGVHAPNASTTASKPARSAAVRSKRSFRITARAAERFSPRTTAVTSRPRETASSTMRRPAFPFAQTTASFIWNPSGFLQAVSPLFVCSIHSPPRSVKYAQFCALVTGGKRLHGYPKGTNAKVWRIFCKTARKKFFSDFAKTRGGSPLAGGAGAWYTLCGRGKRESKVRFCACIPMESEEAVSCRRRRNCRPVRWRRRSC